MSLDTSKLVNVKVTPDGWQCQCPQCAREGHDKTGRNHLRIWRTGAFHCAVDDSPAHNRAIRALLRGYSDDTAEVVYIEPKLDIQQVYPESTLAKLLPDYGYWKGRGAKESVVASLGGGLAPQEEKSKLSGRFIFPCRDADDKLVGFAGRLIQESSYAPKWKILGSKKSFVFPSWSLSGPAAENVSQVILVEGIGCVIALAQTDTWNTMCLFGLDISSRQLSFLIGRGINHVVIATNNETSGIGNQAATKLKKRLESFFPRVDIHLPYAKDFMEMSEVDITKWKEQCIK